MDKMRFEEVGEGVWVVIEKVGEVGEKVDKVLGKEGEENERGLVGLDDVGGLVGKWGWRMYGMSWEKGIG